jgi:hypothetical protein
MGSDEFRPDRSGVLVTIYAPFEYDKAQLGYDPGPIVSRYSATVNIFDAIKSGSLDDQNSKINQIVGELVADGCNDIRILPAGNRHNAPILHLHNGILRQGRIMKTDRKDGYEELSFVTQNPPIGGYLVSERSLTNQEAVEKE